MAKSNIKKLYHSKYYKETMCNYILNEQEIQELNSFCEINPFVSWRVKFICQCLILKYKNWNKIWYYLKTIPNSSEKYFKIFYGKKNGQLMYLDVNKRKTECFIHTPEKQKERNKKAIEKKKELGNCENTTIRYWIERHNMSEIEAKKQVSLRQKTFTKEKCIEKYGHQQGIEIWQERQLKWQQSIIDNTENNNIGFKRSHSLERYIERADGDETEGLKNYLYYRKNLSGFGKASKESLNLFLPISEYLKKIHIDHYFGYNGSKEWHIYDKENKKSYFYDFTIPKLNLIIEYHGETWHPNPIWDVEKWNTWIHPHSKLTANERYNIDKQKNNIAQKNGWDVLVIYSSQPLNDMILTCIEKINLKNQ